MIGEGRTITYLGTQIGDGDEEQQLASRVHLESASTSLAQYGKEVSHCLITSRTSSSSMEVVLNSAHWQRISRHSTQIS